jgi:hypothetical protein
LHIVAGEQKGSYKFVFVDDKIFVKCVFVVDELVFLQVVGGNLNSSKVKVIFG